MIPSLGNDITSQKSLGVIDCLTVSLGRHIALSLSHLLLIVECLAMCVFIFSIYHHWALYMENSTLKTMEPYFFNFLPMIVNRFFPTNNKYLFAYDNYKYSSTRMNEGITAVGVVVVHKQMHSVYALGGDINPSNELCSLYAFGETEDVEVVPDSYFSTIVLPISSFLWGAYLVTLSGIHLLEKRISQASFLHTNKVILGRLIRSPYMKHLSFKDLSSLLGKIREKPYSQERLISMLLKKDPIAIRAIVGSPIVRPLSYKATLAIYLLVFLLSVFGVYAMKRTNTFTDSYLVCMWEVIKCGFIFVI